MPAAFATTSQHATSMPESATAVSPCGPSKVNRRRSFCSIAIGTTGSPFRSSP
jgi:hypothetical protein